MKAAPALFSTADKSVRYRERSMSLGHQASGLALRSAAGEMLHDQQPGDRREDDDGQKQGTRMDEDGKEGAFGRSITKLRRPFEGAAA